MPIQVAIIGAGIAGLTTAILLKEKFAQNELQVTIYEQRDAINPMGGGLTIWPNGTQILFDLPCGADIRKMVGDFKNEYWGNPEGDTLRILDRDIYLQINGSPFMNVCRSDLQELLLNTLGKENVVFGKKLKNIQQNKNGVKLYFNHDECFDVDLVIGADGTFSTVRNITFPDAKLEYAGYVAMIGICQFSKADKPKHNFIWGKNRMLGCIPVSQDRHMIYTICPLEEGALKNVYNTQEEQFRLFSGWSKEGDQTLRLFRNTLVSPQYAKHYFCSENYDMKPLTGYHNGNAVLLGDAAHPMGSIMGFGTSSALEDAQSLVNDLRNEATIETALKKFSQERLINVIPLINLENERKTFLIHANDKRYEGFERFIRSAGPAEFLKLVFTVLENKAVASSDVN